MRCFVEKINIALLCTLLTLFGCSSSALALFDGSDSGNVGTDWTNTDKNLSTTGNGTFGGDLSIGDDTSLTGDLTVGGAVTLNTTKFNSKVIRSDYDYTSLAVAISSIGDTPTRLFICQDNIVADGTTITQPSTLTFDFTCGGSIDGIAGGGTETFVSNGTIIKGVSNIVGSNITATFNGNSATYIYNTIAALRLISGSPGSTALVNGYYVSGDGAGGPIRTWKTGATGTYTDNGGSIIVPTGGDGSGAWILSSNENYHVKWFGAKGDSVNDDTAAIRAAIAATPIGGTVFFDNGTYKITDTVIISRPGINLLGEAHGGRLGATIKFVPTSGKTCFLFDAVTAGAMYNNSLKNISFSSLVADGNFTKVAIETKDADTLLVENVSIIYWYGNNSSVGIKTGGRQFLKYKNIYVYADKPIQISQNPYRASVALIDIDQTVFENLYLVVTYGTNNPCVTIDSGVHLTNVSFYGHQSWVVYGGHGLYWNDTTSTGASSGLSLSNIRIEQDSDASKFMFYISTNSGLQNLRINNVYGGLGCGGFYFRLVSPSLSNIFYVNNVGGLALDIDNSVYKLVVDNCYWQTGTTANISSHRIVYGTNPTTGPLIDNGVYEALSGPGAGNGLMKSAAINGDLTPGLILRRSNLYIFPGTTAGTLKAELANLWNGDVIASTDNIGKGATVGNFELNAAGTILSILDSGITGTIVTTLATEFQNYTGTALYSAQGFVDGTKIAFNIKSNVSGTSQDLTALGGFSITGITYLTK